jgi:hypothetical protein
MTRKPFTENDIRALVDEVLNRTPRGGFPEIERREGLKPGTLFDWVEQYGPPRPPLPFSALHFWIGNTPLPEHDFGTYFDYAENYWSHEVEDIEAAQEDMTGCGFCIDLNMRFLYDEDLLLVIWLAKPVPVAQLVAHSTLESDASAQAIVVACAQRGIHTANAMFVYADPAQVVADTEKRYNGLPYIGLFASKERR